MSYGMALLDEVNTMAERSPGFVWRMQARGNSTDVTVGDDPLVIVNLTVWESADHLFALPTARITGVCSLAHDRGRVPTPPSPR